MRTKGLGVLALLILISPALVIPAAAEQRRGPASSAPAAAAPRVSAPPAPRISAPAVSVPRFTAPSTPRFTTQPRFISPGVSGPRFATPPSTLRVYRRTPSIATQQRRVITPMTRRAITATPGTIRGTRHTLTPRIATPGVPTRIIRKPITLGQGPAAPGRHLATSARLVRSPSGQFGVSNPVFSKLSHRDPAARRLRQSTFHGAFADAGAWRKDWRWHRHGHRHGRFVLGFVGPVFWPYAYDDFVDYTFWPAAYDTFWPYAFDDVYEGIYGGYAPDIYSYGERGSDRTAYGPRARRGRASLAAAPVCSGQTQGLTDLPIERIAQQVGPDQNQQALLDELKTATQQALQIMQNACPTEFASTPTGRMTAMRERVAAMLQAVRTMRSPLDKFYAALTDEQKERFNALDAETVRSASASQGDISQACDSRAARAADVPFTRIELSLRLTDVQAAALGELKDASARAAEALAQNCRADQSLTPTGRLLAMEQRLNSLLQALDAVQPALAKFYDSLSDEQKAQFNRLSPAA